MKYMSTRGGKQYLTAAEAIIAGLADDGGLFVPEKLPQVDEKFIDSLLDLSYVQRAVRVLGCFLTDYTEQELAECVNEAYGNDGFDNPAVAPVVSFSGNHNVLELWHGPTSAFKDMALQLLPRLMSTALRHQQEQDEVVILVATSGDTGKAALEGFKDAQQIRILVFYPQSGVSRIQRLQMVTQQGNNVQVAAVQGNFDDTQTGVKNIFADEQFNKELNAQGFKLSSANSINWGRLAPQIVYYFSAYADLIKEGRLKTGDKVNFVVPTGNFGNILAGYYAKCMGLPVNKFICASNANNVLTDFLNTGIYDRNREFYKTNSPSMDILISSNLERLLHAVTGDSKQVSDWMQQLKVSGRYEITPMVRKKIAESFAAGFCDDAVTLRQIKEVYDRYDYVIDTHTAVAWRIADEYMKNTGDKTPLIIVSTASPYKFNESVLTALTGKAEGDEFALLEQLAALNKNKIPKPLAALKQAAIRHNDVCRREDMSAEVRKFLFD